MVLTESAAVQGAQVFRSGGSLRGDVGGEVSLEVERKVSIKVLLNCINLLL